MRSIISYISCFMLVLVLVIGNVSTSNKQSISSATSTETIRVIIEELEIDSILKEKGLCKEDEEVIMVIQLDIGAQPLDELFAKQSGLSYDWIWNREFYAKVLGSEDIVQNMPENVNDYPGGSFSLVWEYKPCWQEEFVIGFVNDILDGDTGRKINSSDILSYTYESPTYNDYISVELYINYERAYLYIYDEDVIFDDFVGALVLQREAGYTIKVIKQ